MIRVLHVFGGLGTGGTESLIMNWYRNIDREKIQFDFLVRSPDNNYLAEIEALGGRVYYTASFPRHFLKNYRETKEILARKEWAVIHVHGNAAIYTLPLRLAKKYGYPVRIMHSHNVKTQNRYFSVIHYFNRKAIRKTVTWKLACSESSGKWMYGNSGFKVLKNAVETERFIFNTETRNKYRKELCLSEQFVVGHVGRFAIQKNHGFLLDIFAEIKKLKNNSKLVLVGDGPMKPEIERKADALGLKNDVLFLGRRNDVGAIMSAMDIFVLPSLYEGLPVACVECCANELDAVISEEAYAKEIDELPNVHIFSLKRSAEEWAEFIIDMQNAGAERGKQNLTGNCGFDIKEIVAELSNIYLGN